MMPSLNLFRQSVAEGEAHAQMSNVGIALLVLCAAISAGSWQAFGPRWFIVLPLLAGIYCAFSLKVAAQWQKVAVLRLGRYRGLRGPGLFHIIPVIDSVSQFVDQRVRVTDVRAETALTRDTVPVSVDAIVFWVVWNP
jgi:regulator of protease activity HflC (stomatin/prohibitin superfamily)